MQINAINSLNFRQNSKIEEYKKLQEARNFRVEHFSELSPAEQDKVFIRIAQLDQESNNPLTQAIEKFLISSCRNK